MIPHPKLRYDETGFNGGPAIMWDNPWSDKPEAICAFWWPTHPPEVTAMVEQLWEQFGNQFAEAPAVARDLSAMIRQMCWKISKSEADASLKDLGDKAMSLLKRHGLDGSPLRSDNP